MSQRTIRVNELVRRELSSILHSTYRSESVAITITEVSVSPDLRNARVFYSVIGDAAAQADAGRLFARIGKDLRQRLSKAIVLKYLPHLHFRHDPGMARGAATLDVIEQLDREDADEDGT
ncbi:MAG: ribosome-binding factor A [Opitutales bacterium]